MGDYISREVVINRLLKIIESYQNYVSNVRPDVVRHCINVVDSIPAADVRENKRGKWLSCKPYNPEFNGYECSECGAKYQDLSPYNFCPNCGARMEEQT